MSDTVKGWFQTAYWIIGIGVALGLIGIFANFMVGIDDRKDEAFKNECIEKGGTYTDFETDRWLGECSLNGETFHR